MVSRSREIPEKPVTDRFQFRGGEHSGYNDTSGFAGRARRAYDMIDMRLQYLSGGLRRCACSYPEKLVLGNPGYHCQFYLSRSGCHPSRGRLPRKTVFAIDGKTLHFIAMTPLNGTKQSADDQST